MSILIKVSKVDKHFENVHALKSVSMCIRRGSIYGLVGTNGSGKTTILKHITGIIRPDSGSITLDGRTIYENTAAKQSPYFLSDPKRKPLINISSITGAPMQTYIQ